MRFFADYMLELGPYYVVRHQGEIVSAGGVHVLSKDYGVAALGNIATNPSYRGRGYGKAVTAAVALSIANKIPDIGLNVRKDNLAAIRCYESLGFTRVLDFEEGPASIFKC